MADRHFPVRPNLEQLRHQAKDLLRAIRNHDPAALEDLQQHHPERLKPSEAKLADAQLTLARCYGIASWPRLVLACQMTDAIWMNDVERLREIVVRHPELLHENVTVPRSNWGPPMSYAANLGRDEIIAMLRGLGAEDVQRAFDRACLQGRVETARTLFAMGARPVRGIVMGPCETLNAGGLAFLLELGAEFCDEHGDRFAPVGLLLQTYSRGPVGKHRCLDIVEQQGIKLPDTPPMAMHRGRIDLMAKHLERDPNLFKRAFTHREIFPLELGCHEDESLALTGTPLGGTTLLHMCADYDEIEMARWMLDNGADANARAAIDAEGFGGYTPLFGCVVSQAYRAYARRDDAFASLLLTHGADASVRASLRKRLRFVPDETMHEYGDVTALEWAERFHDQDWVNPEVMKLLRAAGK